MVLNIVYTLININRYFRLIFVSAWLLVEHVPVCRQQSGTRQGDILELAYEYLCGEYTVCITHIIMTAP